MPIGTLTKTSGRKRIVDVFCAMQQRRKLPISSLKNALEMNYFENKTYANGYPMLTVNYACIYSAVQQPATDSLRSVFLSSVGVVHGANVF